MFYIHEYKELNNKYIHYIYYIYTFFIYVCFFGSPQFIAVLWVISPSHGFNLVCFFSMHLILHILITPLCKQATNPLLSDSFHLRYHVNDFMPWTNVSVCVCPLNKHLIWFLSVTCVTNDALKPNSNHYCLIETEIIFHSPLHKGVDSLGLQMTQMSRLTQPDVNLSHRMTEFGTTYIHTMQRYNYCIKLLLQ